MPNENIRNILGCRKQKLLRLEMDQPIQPQAKKKTTVQAQKKRKRPKWIGPINHNCLERQALKKHRQTQKSSNRLLQSPAWWSALAPHTTDADDTVFHWTYPAPM